jgi:hypothetical protein
MTNEALSGTVQSHTVIRVPGNQHAGDGPSGLVLMEVAAAIAAMLVSLTTAQHLLGERHVYFGLILAYVLVQIIVDAKYWAMDKVDEAMESEK